MCWGMSLLSFGSSFFFNSLDSEMSQMDEITDVDVMEVELQWSDINWLWHKVQE